MSAVIKRIKKLQYRYITDREPCSRYVYAIQKSRVTGIKFDIPKEEYMKIVVLPCHYCGMQKFETGTGLDRINSALGYSLNNVVPCCHFCNIMKSIFPKEMFLTAVKNIYEHAINRRKRTSTRDIKSKKEV
jgi:hypothetical protein